MLNRSPLVVLARRTANATTGSGSLGARAGQIANMSYNAQNRTIWREKIT
mgnify:CR=1 FL=1